MVEVGAHNKGHLVHCSMRSSQDLTLWNLAASFWVFDTERYGIWWANAQALQFWRADSLEDLSQRAFSTDGSSVRRRLSNIRINKAINVRDAMPHGGTLAMTCARNAVAATTADDLPEGIFRRAADQRHRGGQTHIIDDDDSVRVSIVRSVEQLGYRVTWSEDAMVALDKIANGLEADLYLIDVLLAGGLTGTDFAAHIRGVGPRFQSF